MAISSNIQPTDAFSSPWCEAGRKFIESYAWNTPAGKTEIEQWLHVAADIETFPGVRPSYVWSALIEQWSRWTRNDVRTTHWAAQSLNYATEWISECPEIACQQHYAGVGIDVLLLMLHEKPENLTRAVDAGLDLKALYECLKQHETLIYDTLIDFYDDDTPRNSPTFILSSLVYKAITQGAFQPPHDAHAVYSDAWYQLPSGILNDSYAEDIQRLMQALPFSLGPLLSSLSHARSYSKYYDAFINMPIEHSPVIETMRGFMELYFEQCTSLNPKKYDLWSMVHTQWPSHAALIMMHTQLYNNEEQAYANLESIIPAWISLNEKLAPSTESITMSELV